MNSEQIKNLDNEYIVHSYNRFDVVFDHGENARIFDKDGKEYIDLTSGIGVNSLGFCNKGWIEAITAQLGRLQHSSNLRLLYQTHNFSRNLWIKQIFYLYVLK